MAEQERPLHEFTFATGRKAAIIELNGLEQFQADKAANSSEMLPIMYYRAVASLRMLDGQNVSPALDTISLNGKLQKLHGRESDELVKVYNTAFSNFTPEELGNESKPDDSPPTS